MLRRGRSTPTIQPYGAASWSVSLQELKLPTFLREYGKMAGRCAAERVAQPGYLLRLSELELIDRHHRMVDRRIKAARFPVLHVATAPALL